MTEAKSYGVFPYSPAALVEFAHDGRLSKIEEVREAAESVMSYAVFCLDKELTCIPDELEPSLMLLLRAMIDE